MKKGEKISLQYIAYEIDTYDTAKTEQIYAQIGGKVPSNLSDTEKQIRFFRFLVDHLCNILDYQISQKRISTADLVIFAAPEFYLKDRVCLPFNAEVVEDGKNYMGEKFKNYKNVLILPGSIWWWEKYQDKTTGGPNAAIHNSVPVFYAGRNILNWNKKFLSSIDGLGKADANWGPATHWDQKVKSKTTTPIYDGDPNAYGTIKVKDIDLTFGIEICLDHAYHYLRQHNNGHLDMHVLLCAGMPYNKDAFACRKGGVFLRCEGGRGFSNNRSNCMINNAPSVNTDALVHNYASLASRPLQADERIAVYEPVQLVGPS